MESLLNCWLSWYLELHGLSFRSLEECFRLRSILLALFSARVDKWHKQSGISLNLRTGPADHATLFNQWEGALVFSNKQIKHRPSDQKLSLVSFCLAPPECYLQSEMKIAHDTNLIWNVYHSLFWLIDICWISQPKLLPLHTFLVCKYSIRGESADALTWKIAFIFFSTNNKTGTQISHLTSCEIKRDLEGYFCCHRR